MYRIIRQGASAVQLGTRFVATRECDAAPEFKEAFITARDEDIQIIKSPVGMPGRTIYNSFIKETSEGKRKPASCKYNCISSCNPRTTPYCIADALISAYHGNLENGFVFTGSNAGRIYQITTVRDVFSDLEKEFKEAGKEK